MLEFLASNDAARLAFLALLFGIVAIFAFAVSQFVVRRSAIRGELRELKTTSISADAVSLQDRKQTRWGKLAEKIEQAGLNLTDTNQDSLRDKLRAAGFTSASAPKVFTLAKLLLVLVLPVVYIVLVNANVQDPTFTQLYVIAGFIALAGLFLPNLFVTARADRRREAITNGFPDCLDLMLVCVEAGLGLEAAMDRVGREMINSHPLNAELLVSATMHLRAGAQREDALRQMGERSGVEEIRSFATLLIQSDKLGTSVADTLRVYANEMREKRRLRAEEKAHRLPVIISIPLVVNMLPVMIGVLMMPGAVRVVRQLLPALAGGG